MSLSNPRYKGIYDLIESVEIWSQRFSLKVEKTEN